MAFDKKTGETGEIFVIVDVRSIVYEWRNKSGKYKHAIICRK